MMACVAWLFALATALWASMAMADDTRPLDPAEWHLYRSQYIKPEGRVVDAVNGGITHSEGQGYAMVLATAYNDRATFDLLWKWTQANLSRPHDHLFSWKFVPGKARKEDAVPDPNDAADGDLLIAWALTRASSRWHETAYRLEALSMEHDIREHLIRDEAGATILLPGEKGFADHKKLVVNLSYWVFPAIDALGQLSGQPVWGKLSESGLKLLDQAAYGRWGLPPDWLAVRPRLEIAEGFDPWFGYNAIRIPLYLIWGGREANRLNRYVAFWDFFARAPFMPTWTDLVHNGADTWDAQPGIKAIIALSRIAASGRKAQMSDLPELSSDQSYYSASLLLLSKLAILEAP